MQPVLNGVHTTAVMKAHLPGMLQEALSFDKVMRGQSLEMLKTLERWVERQATGLDMAANPDALKQSFDKLLKVGHLGCSLAHLHLP